MPSVALGNWQSTGQAALDEIEAAHAAVGGVGPGRRYATQQINQAYVVLLSSQFQRFCRNLHTEAVDALTSTTAPDVRMDLLRLRMSESRQLDSKNPSPSSIGADYNRFGLDWWNEIKVDDPRNVGRQKALEQLNVWRNAIAHQDFSSSKLDGRATIRLSDVRVWRQACSSLAVSFDRVSSVHLGSILGAMPW